jgi:hypothetical protein
MDESGTKEARAGERTHVNRIRGIVMLLAGGVAAWKGWQIHHGERAAMAYGLAVLALALGVWHLRRKEPPAIGSARPDATSGKPTPGDRL